MTPRRAFASNQPLALACALAAAAAYATYASARFSGDKLYTQYFYVVPIVIPFVAFIFDRAAGARRYGLIRSTLDALVVGVSMARVVGHVPVVSGHALFLTYTVLSTKSRVARVTAALVLAQVVYLKLAWHDWAGLTSGMVIGTIAAIAYRWQSAGDEREFPARPPI